MLQLEYPPLKLHLVSAAGQNLFTGYGEGYVLVNQQRYQQSLIVLPDKIISNWPVPEFALLEAGHLELILPLGPEIVLLGTGRTQRFPSPRLTRGLAQARIGLEVMDTFAACRTYNILMGEGRRVAAALLLS